ncbi:uncharacterized protein PAN0_006c3045 [Moesziomyces antarcticus]|uniref:Uncharacterized protein n=1 Tax=Pseudozyma antarctica TaxID=84753 RepID=A0A081CDT4_PSEA2|nr:uncharacterized protein PAN0_006c3045 [Moesziomyces antarcticus]GAK64830.1 hypothetical protein PAN0_006c3045 [Moesziomyces antarcticus]
MQPAATDPLDGVRWLSVNGASVGGERAQEAARTWLGPFRQGTSSNATLRARKGVQECLPASSPAPWVLQSRDSVVGNADKMLPSAEQHRLLAMQGSAAPLYALLRANCPGLCITARSEQQAATRTELPGYGESQQAD